MATAASPPTATSAARSSRPAAPARTTSTPRPASTEVQAGSYALMDTAYAKLGLPFEQALFVVGTVIAVKPGARRRRRRPEGARHGPRQPVDRRRQRVVLQRRARHVRAHAASVPRSATGSASSRPTSTRRWRCTRWPGSSTATTSSSAGRSTSAAGDDASLRHGAAWAAVAGMAATAVAAVDDARRRHAGGRCVRSLMPWSALSAVPARRRCRGDRAAPRSPSRRRRRRGRRGDGGAARRPAPPAARRPAPAPLRDHPRQPALRQPPRRRRPGGARPARRRRRSRSASSRRPTAAGLHALVARRDATRTRSSSPTPRQRHRGCGAAGR